MKLNIQNLLPRVIMCKEVQTGDCFPNGELLKCKKKYHLSRIKVCPWHTEVYLKEFPGKVFNSVQFAECFKLEVEIKKLLQAKKREGRIIATFSKENMPQIILSNTGILDLSSYKEDIALLELGEVFTIGRNVDCDIKIKNDTIYSPLHCYISKTTIGKYALYDCSLNGTFVSL